MVFKLVRTDTDDPRKITLHPGTYFVGRGNLIDCDDKRVSRKHFAIDVDEGVTVKALHLNPIFYKKIDTVEVQIIKQNTSINVSHGDKIGLLPKSFWYELLRCDSDSESARKPENRVTNSLKPDEQQSISATESTTNDLENSTDEEQVQSTNIHEALTQIVESPVESQSILEGADSPSMLASAQSPSFTPPNRNSPAVLETAVSLASTETIESQESPPLKRCHSPQDSSEEAKKVRVEPQDSEVSDVKQEPGTEPQPGPSGDQGRASTSDQGNGNAGAVPPNVGANAQPPARERCYYGEKCYRRNPVHKAQFAHPLDADWGAGERTACPYGAACARADPRHSAVHDHPAGWVPSPPTPPRLRPAKQSGTKKRRRVTSLTDDEESDEDSSTNLIVAGKRTRKTVKRENWSGSDLDEEEDPFQTDESDDWVPEDHSHFTQDTED